MGTCEDVAKMVAYSCRKAISFIAGTEPIMDGSLNTS